MLYLNFNQILFLSVFVIKNNSVTYFWDYVPLCEWVGSQESEFISVQKCKYSQPFKNLNVPLVWKRRQTMTLNIFTGLNYSERF